MKNYVGKAVLIAVILAWAFPAAVFAHAFLDHADPKVGSEVDAAPSEVKIYFTEEIEPAFSSIQVLDPNGKQIDKKDFHLDPKDKKLAIVSLPPLSAGKYKVVWQVVSADTHKTQGDFTFTVKAAKPVATSQATPSTATGPATATKPGPQNPSSNATK
jgi:methionine-rich copper-binding protein CopC